MSTDRDTEETLERLRAVVRANPRSTTFVALAHALCDSGRDQEAEEVSRQGLSQHPRLVTGQVALGRALMARGRLREAQEVLVDAAKSSPEHGDAFRWLGDLMLRRGGRERGRAILEYAEELMPTDPHVSELLVKAGGQPMPRAVRPKTDFEHTRVGNARALAERMHEDPPGDKASVESRRGPLSEGPTLVQPTSPGETSGANGKSPPAENTEVSAAPLDEDEDGDDPAGGVTDDAEDSDDPEETTTDSSSAIVTEVRGRAGGSAARASRGIDLLHRATRFWEDLPSQARMAAIGGGGAVLVGGLVLILTVGRNPPPPLHPTVTAVPQAPPPPTPAPPPLPPVNIAAALADGSADRLMEVRALGRRLLAGGPADGDQLAGVALADALLASDFGLSSAADANEAADTAAQVKPPHPARTAVLEAARSLTALSVGHRTEARAAADRAVAADADSAAARLARGRVELREGDLLAARNDLEKARAAAPDGTVVALEWSSLALDSADPATAKATLESLLVRKPTELRARLLLAEAARALATPPDTASLREPCRSEGRDHPVLRAACAAQTAAIARLAGDRSPALRGARQALAIGARNPRAVAQGALVLALLGDIDGAADALRKIQDETTGGFPPRYWADLAVTLGRGQRPDVPSTGAVKPNGPEARLVAARAAFAAGGPSVLATLLRDLGPTATAFDPDLAAFAALVDEGKIAKSTRADLEKRAQRGSAMAGYVLGRDLLAAGDRRAAAKRLQKALQGHGDTCEAARLLSGIPKRLRPSAIASDARLAHALGSRNSDCSYLAK